MIKKTLNDDALLTALQQVTHPTTKTRLSSLASQMLNDLDADSDKRRDFFEHHFLGKRLKDSYITALKFYKCICNLLQSPTDGSTSVHDVTWFLNYRGAEAFSKAVRSFLTMPEPEGENFTRAKQDSRTLLQDCVQDVLRTAGTSQDASAQLQVLQKALEEVPVEPTPGCCHALKEAMSKLGQLERSLRKGGADALKKMCGEVARAMADKASAGSFVVSGVEGTKIQDLHNTSISCQDVFFNASPDRGSR